MDSLTRWLVTVPPPPRVDLPVGARALGLRAAVEAACVRSFLAGAEDGLAAGFLLASGLALAAALALAALYVAYRLGRAFLAKGGGRASLPR